MCKENEEKKEAILPLPLDQILKQVKNSDIPEETKKTLLACITREEVHFSGTFPAPNPIADKITTEHISEIIKSGDEADKRSFEAMKFTQISSIIGVFIILVFILAVIFIFKNSPEYIAPIITLIAGLAGGGAGGYGIGYTKGRDSN